MRDLRGNGEVMGEMKGTENISITTKYCMNTFLLAGADFKQFRGNVSKLINYKPTKNNKKFWGYNAAVEDKYVKFRHIERGVEQI